MEPSEEDLTDTMETTALEISEGGETAKEEMILEELSKHENQR